MRHEKKYPPYPVIDMKATGQNLRRLRSERGYSVKDLQTYLGMEYPQAVSLAGRYDAPQRGPPVCHQQAVSCHGQRHSGGKSRISSSSPGGFLLTAGG